MIDCFNVPFHHLAEFTFTANRLTEVWDRSKVSAVKMLDEYAVVAVESDGIGGYKRGELDKLCIQREEQN